MDRKTTPSQFKRILLLIAFGAVILSAAWHFSSVISFVRTVIGFLSPAIIGFVIAFILNVPMSALSVCSHVCKPNIIKKCVRISIRSLR